MFQRLTAMFVALMALVVTSSLAVTPDEMGQALPKKLDHPYLYFSKEDLPKLRERAESDEVNKRIYDKMLSDGEKLLSTVVEKTPPQEDRRPRYTGNWSYHNYIDNNWANALKLAFLYQMTGETKYAAKAFEFADVVCDVSHWEDPAHQFPTIYSRVKPWNVPSDQVVFDYDLYAAHTAHALSMVYDWIYDWMDVRQRDRIRGALLEKAILRVRGNWDYHWWATAYRCNWVEHCSSGVGIASLTLLKEDPQLIDMVAESYNRIWRSFDEIGIDGGWQEGTGYSRDIYEWAVKFGVPFKRVTNGKYTVLKHPRIQEHPVSFLLWSLLPPGQMVNFGDTGNRVIRKSAVFNVLAEETQSPEAAWYAKNICASDRKDFWDIIFPLTTVEPALPEMKSRHFRTIDYVVMRSSFTDTETVTLACKTGRHTDPHHGHLDCGDWDVHWRGESYIRGIGNIPYDEKCFDDARWTYPQAGSQGQNVIFVNGEKQIPGRWRGQPMDESVGGDVLEYRYGDDLEYVLMDGSNAYPKKELKKWRRHFILDKPEVTVVLDEITSAKGAKIESRIHPIGDVEVADDNSYLLLKGKRGTVAVITVAGAPIQYVPDHHTFQAAQLNARVRIIPYVDTELIAPGTETMISTIVLPVEDKTEARAVAESVERSVDKDGGLTLSFTAKGRTHRYRYERSDHGLVLAQ